MEYLRFTQQSDLNTEIMKSVIATIIAVLVVASLSQGTDSTYQAMFVGQIVPGKIDPSVSNQKTHPISIETPSKKYLFIRLSSSYANQAAIGLYSNSTGQLLFSCMQNAYDSCYIPSKDLTPNTQYIILVMSNVPIQYHLYTFWADIEHLKPDQDVKFMFDQDKTQLFHLDLDNKIGDFKQLRIVLRPQTARSQGDNLKIFANRGFNKEPTQQVHDYKSIHVWNDAQAIFLSAQQLKNQEGVSIYVVGDAKTVYILSCEIIKKDHHDININENLYQYLSPKQETTYHISLQQKEETKNVQIYIVRFSVFTGELQVGFFYDKEMTKVFQETNYQYMSDLQFHINKEQLVNQPKDLYMLVRCRDTAATFQINFQGRRKQESFEFFENLFQFIPLTKNIQSLHYYSNIWSESQAWQQKTQKFDFSLINVEGDSYIQFYKCKPNQSQQICRQKQNKDFSQATQKLIPIGKTKIGSKTIYTIQLNSNDYTEIIKTVQKRAIIIVHISSVNDRPAFVALELSNTNKVRSLRDGRAFQDKVKRDQVKLYKYENPNPNIGKIKIILNQISGLTNIKATQGQTSPKTLPLSQFQPNTIQISQNLNQPIFITVKGIVTSIYTLTVVTVHKEHPLSTSLTLSQDIEYQVKIMPFTYVNVELHPIQANIVFEFNSVGGSIVVCEIDGKELCRDGTQRIGNKGEIEIDARNIRDIRFRLGNFANVSALTNQPNPKQVNHTKPLHELIRPVKVNFKYHATAGKHCQQRKMNKVYSQSVDIATCFKFHLALAGDLQIMASKQNLIQTAIKYFVCSENVTPVSIGNRVSIKAETIVEKCKNFPDDMYLSMVLVDVSKRDNSLTQIRMDYSVQFTNDVVTLADGVAYYTSGKSSQQAIKTFFYEIIDENQPFQIVLINKKGKQRFYAKITTSADRYTSLVNEAMATIDSKNSNYYQNPSIVIKKDDIAKAQCGRNCMVVISVFSEEKPGTDIQFGIEVTQHETVLKEGQIRSDFLAQGSFHYYEYTAKLNPTDLLFKISDNNRKCTRSYLSVHPYPSSQNYIALQNEGSLSYKNAQKNRFYFAVQAKEDCPYTLMVSQGNNKLVKLQLGQSYDFKLAEGEETWFYLYHMSKSSFKLLSLLKHGLLDISVNVTDIDKKVLEDVVNGKVQVKKFLFKNTYQNAMTISSDAKGFCSQCYYLVNVKAKKITQGSIILSSQSSRISLEAGKVLFDELKKQNSTSLATFYKVSSGSMILNLISGKIKVQMSYADQKFQKTFQKNKTPYNQSYQFTPLPSIYTPIKIKITALSAPAVYSFELYPFKENQTSVVKLSPGFPSIIAFQSDQDEQCFQGTLRSKDEEIILATDLGENVNFNDFTVKSTLNSKQVTTVNQVIGKVMSIKFDIKETFFAQAQRFYICLKPTKKVQGFIELSVTQNQKMNLIAPDTMNLVRGEGTFAIHHTGYVVVDLFECSGKADVSYSSDMKELESKQPQNLDVIGISGQNHAIRLETSEVLFLKVKVGFGSLLWMPLSEQKERGIGYYKYAIGKLAYETSFNNIKFKFGGVYRSKQTNTTIQSVRYTLHISNSRETLQRAVLCQMTNVQNSIQIQVGSSKVGDGTAPEIQFNVEKRKISESFPDDQTLYFNIVADMILVAPNQDKDHEHYRFVYFEQIVLAELLRQNAIQSKINFNIFIPIIISTAVSIISILFFVVKWVVPALARFKNRVLVEENNSGHGQVEMEAPPSSERNQMGAGTAQQMN